MPKVYKQYIIPVEISDTRRIECRLNVDNDDFYQTDPIEELTLDSRYFRITRNTMSELERLTQDENAEPVPGRLEVTLMDCSSYAGTLGDGTPVSEVLAKGNQRGAWSSSTAYAVDDIVTTSDNLSWIAIASTTGDEPSANPTKWLPWAPTLGKLIFRDHSKAYGAKWSQQWSTTLTATASGTSCQTAAPVPDDYEVTFGEATVSQERAHVLSSSGSGPFSHTLHTSLANSHASGEAVWIRELFFEGDIDPDIVPQKPNVVFATQSGSNLIAHPEQTIQLRMTAFLGRAQKVLIKYLIEGNPVTGLPNENPLIRGQRFTGFQQSDMHNSDGAQWPEYSGISFDTEASDTIRVGNFKAPVLPHVGIVVGFDWHTPPSGLHMYRLADYDTDTADPNHLSHSGTGAAPDKWERHMYHISFDSIMSKACEFLGVEWDSSLCTTDMKGWRQIWNPTTDGWDHSMIVPAASYLQTGLLNYNYWFGLRSDFDPFGAVKRYFSTPITYDLETSVIRLIDDIATFFGCDIDDEYNQLTLKQRLVLKAKREERGALPPEPYYEVSSSIETVDNTMTKERVIINNRADDAKMSAPVNYGSAATIEVAPRVRNFGRKDGLLTIDCSFDPKTPPNQMNKRVSYMTDPADGIGQDDTQWVWFGDPDSSAGHIFPRATSTGAYNADGITCDLTITNGTLTPEMEGHQIKILIGGAVPSSFLITAVSSGGAVITIDELIPAGTYIVFGIQKSVPNVDGFPTAAIVKYFYSGTTNVAYPTGWNSRSSYAADRTNWKGYYGFTAWEHMPIAQWDSTVTYQAGDIIATSDNNVWKAKTTTTGNVPSSSPSQWESYNPQPADNYVSCNSVWSLLQLYTNEIVGHKTVESITFSGLPEEDGSFANIKPGRTITINGVKYRAIKVGPHPIRNTVQGIFVDVPPTYPALTIYKTFTSGQFGATTGGTLGNTASGGGSAGNSSASDTAPYVTTIPASDHRNLIVPKTTAEPIESMLPSGGTQNHYSAWTSDGTTRVFYIDKDGAQHIELQADVVGATVKMASGQTNHAIVVEDHSGSVLALIDAVGTVTGTNLQSLALSAGNVVADGSGLLVNGSIDLSSVTGVLDVLHGGTGANTLTGPLHGNGISPVTGGPIDLNSSDVTDTLPVPSGGTGSVSFTANGVLIGNGTGALGIANPGSPGDVLTINGSGTPAFLTPTAISSVTKDSTLTGNGTAGTPLGIDLSHGNTWTGAQEFDGNLTVGGAEYNHIVTTSGDYSVASTDLIILCDYSAANHTVTLPSSPTDGRLLIIAKIDSSTHTVTIARNGHNFIDSASDMILQKQGGSVTLRYSSTAGKWLRENQEVSSYSVDYGDASPVEPGSLMVGSSGARFEKGFVVAGTGGGMSVTLSSPGVGGNIVVTQKDIYGSAVLVPNPGGSTVTIANSAFGAGVYPSIARGTPGGALGHLSVTFTTGFMTITSSSTTETSSVFYRVFIP